MGANQTPFFWQNQPSNAAGGGGPLGSDQVHSQVENIYIQIIGLADAGSGSFMPSYYAQQMFQQDGGIYADSAGNGGCPAIAYSSSPISGYGQTGPFYNLDFDPNIPTDGSVIVRAYQRYTRKLIGSSYADEWEFRSPKNCEAIASCFGDTASHPFVDAVCAASGFVSQGSDMVIYFNGVSIGSTGFNLITAVTDQIRYLTLPTSLATVSDPPVCKNALDSLCCIEDCISACGDLPSIVYLQFFSPASHSPLTDGPIPLYLGNYGTGLLSVGGASGTVYYQSSPMTIGGQSVVFNLGCFSSLSMSTPILYVSPTGSTYTNSYTPSHEGTSGSLCTPSIWNGADPTFPNYIGPPFTDGWWDNGTAWIIGTFTTSASPLGVLISE